MENFENRFEEQVVKPFIEQYLEGRTPIPCTLCNNFVKFDQFIDMARGVGAEKIATGHYARIGRHPDTGRWELRRAVDASKDQTYFLFGLTQQQLAHTLFPLGGYPKSRVRELARELSLPVAEKNDSQEICFVPNGDYAAFIDAYFKEQGIEPTRAAAVLKQRADRDQPEHDRAGTRRHQRRVPGDRLGPEHEHRRMDRCAGGPSVKRFVLLVGPMDMSASVGKITDMQSKEVQSIMEEIPRRLAGSGIMIGTTLGDVSEIQQKYRWG